MRIAHAPPGGGGQKLTGISQHPPRPLCAPVAKVMA
jgi:hypothetical protein